MTAMILGVQLSQNRAIERQVPDGKCLGLDGKIRPNRRLDTSHRDRRIVELRVANRQSITAIANEMGCSVGTVHRTLKLWAAP